MSLVHLSKKKLKKKTRPSKKLKLEAVVGNPPSNRKCTHAEIRSLIFHIPPFDASCGSTGIFYGNLADNKFHVQVQCEHWQLITGTGFEFYYVSVWLHSSNLFRQSHNRDQRRTARLVQDDRKVEEALNSNNPEFPMRCVGRWASAAEDRPQLVPPL